MVSLRFCYFYLLWVLTFAQNTTLSQYFWKLSFSNFRWSAFTCELFFWNSDGNKPFSFVVARCHLALLEKSIISRLKSSGMNRRKDRYREGYFRVRGFCCLNFQCPKNTFLWPWRWRQQASLKRSQLRQHSKDLNPCQFLCENINSRKA